VSHNEAPPDTTAESKKDLPAATTHGLASPRTYADTRRKTHNPKPNHPPYADTRRKTHNPKPDHPP